MDNVMCTITECNMKFVCSKIVFKATEKLLNKIRTVWVFMVEEN